MKVQLQGQSLRLRIGEDELARLLAGEDVANETRIAGAVLRHSVRLLPDAAPAGAAAAEGGLGVDFVADGDAWRFGLPAGPLRDYVARLPCRDALEFELGEGDEVLRLAFEVDVRDSVRHRGPPQRRRKPDPA